ncbi:Oligosaccharyltransferase complex subunit OSTC [Brachionus plicatilis]|uniref:Oligosaccharyltransferase complex subunit n=1 Tax=Brachionus plicatilis TaxID=10195 RepID=A0A3M7P9K7_BRAPC|nr:Oligosaccharyltransferase complex subunit OSTC [Brachionus plicatilis]RMZ95394.1 Oligosaccharyltransferase complex subunit OSTC [Brachionus plicatilis]
MECAFRSLFNVLECPDLRLKRPAWFKQPSAMTVFFILLGSYFLVTGGVIYDVIVEPPSIGSTTDHMGRSKPVAFMQWRINGQYIMEGLASSFLFTMGAVGFIILDKTNIGLMPKLNRIIMISIGSACILLSFFTLRIFMKIKMPSYMN